MGAFWVALARQVTNQREVDTVEDSSIREDAGTIAQRIAHHFAAANDLLPGSQQRYDASLAKLKSDPKSVPALIKLVQELPPTNYNKLWLATETLADLEDPRALPVFIEVLNRPTEGVQMQHGVVSPENILQRSLVANLARAISLGFVGADEALLEVARAYPAEDIREAAQKWYQKFGMQSLVSQR